MKTVITIRSDAPVKEALDLMKRNRIHHLVVQRGKELAGIVSDRDIYSRALAGTTLSTELTVEKAMRENVPTITEKTAIQEALEIMLTHQLTALPKVHQGDVSGIVTETDMLKVLHSLLKHKHGIGRVVDEGEAILANPLIQNLMKALADAGL